VRIYEYPLYNSAQQYDRIFPEGNWAFQDPLYQYFP